jgi:hypothetical protein
MYNHLVVKKKNIRSPNCNTNLKRWTERNRFTNRNLSL